MAVDIVIQETIETVDITVNPNIIEVNVTRTTGAGGIQSIVAGTNITVDDTDPLNPIVSATGGGGVESVTGATVDNTDPLNPVVNVPSLTQVLTVGDRVLESITANRDFELADRTKYLQLLGGTLTLDETSITFPANSSIVGSVFDADTDMLFPDGVYYIDTPITEITLNKGDSFELKCAISGVWILTVTNKSSGGGGGTTLQQASDNGGFTNGSTLREGSRDNGFGGGISLECTAAKELQWEDGVQYYFPVGGSIVHANSMNDVIPDNTYDDTKGWAVGSKFLNLVTNKLYECTDATTDTAIWQELGGSNKKEYYAILTYDAGDPTVPIVDEQINEFGAITVGFEYVNGVLIFTSSGLFVKTNVIIQNILTPVNDPLETCFYNMSDSEILIFFYNNVVSPNPNSFINYPFKIKLEKYVTP